MSITVYNWVNFSTLSSAESYVSKINSTFIFPAGGATDSFCQPILLKDGTYAVQVPSNWSDPNVTILESAFTVAGGP